MIAAGYTGPAGLAVDANAERRSEISEAVPERYDPDDQDVLWNLFRQR